MGVCACVSACHNGIQVQRNTVGRKALKGRKEMEGRGGKKQRRESQGKTQQGNESQLIKTHLLFSCCTHCSQCPYLVVSSFSNLRL